MTHRKRRAERLLTISMIKCFDGMRQSCVRQLSFSASSAEKWVIVTTRLMDFYADSRPPLRRAKHALHL